MKRNLWCKIAAVVLLMMLSVAILAAAHAENYYPGPEPKPEEPVVVVPPTPEEPKPPVPVVPPKPEEPKPSVVSETPKTPTTTGNNTPVRNRETYSVTVQYLYSDGSKAAVTYQNKFAPGATFDIFSPNIAGYNRSEARISGKMGRRNESFVVYYYGDGLVMIDDYDTPLGLGDVIINIGDCYE